MPRAWTTAARQPPNDDNERPLTVLITGFGPFLHNHPKNSSWEIASRLPAILPATPDHPTPVHIYVHHVPVRVAYRHVVDLVPRLLPPQNPLFPKPDIVLHIGLAAGRSFYTLERGAHGRGYGAIPDVNGERFVDDEAEKRFPRSMYPTILQTGFDADDTLLRWKANLGYEDPSADAAAAQKPDVRISPDAGNFLCGFIYYNALAHCFALGEGERPVAFMHVPDLSDSDEKLNTGREVTVALIQSLVATYKEKGASFGEPKIDRGEGGRDPKAGTDVNFV